MTEVTQPDDVPVDAPSETGEPFRILFVCTGNTCRSPLAEALALREVRRRGWSGVDVGSAGVAAGPGGPASEGALRVAARHDLDLADHESTPLTRELLVRADLILTMSPTHLAQVRGTGAGERAALITSFARGKEQGEEEPGEDPAGALEGVPDPFGADDEAYEETYRVLSELIRRVMDRLAPVLVP